MRSFLYAGVQSRTGTKCFSDICADPYTTPANFNFLFQQISFKTTMFTKVEIGYIRQTKIQYIGQIIYKSRNWIYSLDFALIVNYIQIYKSRNWIYSLDCYFIITCQKSTKVEIGYIRQTSRCYLGCKYLQKQKLDIFVRLIIQLLLFSIYKSRNWIYSLDMKFKKQ